MKKFPVYKIVKEVILLGVRKISDDTLDRKQKEEKMKNGENGSKGFQKNKVFEEEGMKKG